MSEFSESYHVRGGVPEAVAALVQSGLGGWVFPGDRDWTTVVVDGEYTGDSDDELVGAVAGLLVLYSFAEDHGWCVEVFSGGEELASSRADWTVAGSVMASGAGPEALGPVLGVDPELLEGVFVARNLDGPAPEVLDSFVDALGLSNVDWMSGAYLASGGDPRAQADGVIRVDGRKRVIRHMKDGRPYMPGELNDAQTEQLVEKMLGGARKPDGFPIHSGLAGHSSEGSSFTRPMVWHCAYEKSPPAEDTFAWYRSVLPAAGFEPDVTLSWLEDLPEEVRLGANDEYMTWRGGGFEGLIIIRPAGSEAFLFNITGIRLD